MKLSHFLDTYPFYYLLANILFLGLSIYFYVKSKGSLASKFLIAGFGLFVVIVTLELFIYLRGEFFYFLRDYVYLLLVAIGYFLFIKNYNA